MGEQRGEEREAMGEEEDVPLVLAVSSSLDLCQPTASNVMDSLCDAGVPCYCRRCARSDGAFINLWVLVLLVSSSLDLCQPAASSSRDVQACQ
ncbi:hypothetical protein CFC21_013751 [Triticum aestivum]|uniref:Uncharacterized protein n=2 Tax=Triticum aestivum TaxID=4565 RepID=A0A3B6A0S4_WHEAT|nr:hypothetical protein CFC21_013751 [Triticum aestivum]